MKDTTAMAIRPDEFVIDFVHLARQTCGDHDLELQLLDLFVQRSMQLLDKIAQTGSFDSRRDFAHGLKGSALAIGAKRVARAAAAYEGVVARAADEPSSEAPLVAAYTALAAAVREARGVIAMLRQAA